MNRNDLIGWETTLIAERCAEETRSFYRGLPNSEVFCFELFRRAIVLPDIEARLAIGTTYTPQVRKWVANYAPSLDRVDQEFLADEEIDRFWHSYTAEKLSHATGLKQILAYWHICVKRMAILYEQRNRRPPPIVEPDRGKEIERRERQLAIWAIILSHCHDEQDVILIRKRVAEDMKPKEIFSEMPERFAHVEDIYRRLHNLYDRLSRDQRLKGFWEEN